MNGWGITDKGAVRPQNQDFYAMDLVPGRDIALCVVCDGMGGAKAGNVASSIAGEGFMDYMKNALIQVNEIAELSGLIRRATSYSNSMVYEVAKTSADFFGMGTTLVGVLIVGDYASVINVGDSRAYRITPDGIFQVTKDHSLVEDMIDRGELKREDASHHPDKNLITRALGVEFSVLCDLFELKFVKGEYLLLCTDGLTNFVSDEEILNIINSAEDKSECCKLLLDKALAAGSTDNITAVLLEKEEQEVSADE